MNTNFVDQPIDPKSKLLDLINPITSDPISLRVASEKTGGFKGDSQYDKDLVYGVDQNYLRAKHQPWYDEAGNALIKTAIGIPLGLVENTGYLGDLLFDWDDRDYTNAFVEFAKSKREDIDEALPMYRKDNDTFSMGDSAWWMTHGQGLLESIGEFAITGAGAGAGLGKIARGVAKVVGNGAKANAITQGVAQLGTASGLAFTEGAMSGAEIYKQTYSSIMNDGHDYGDGIKVPVSEEEARRIASDAAAHTVKLNTLINTGLNITSVNALFKTFEKAKIRQALSKGVTEEMPVYLKRLDDLGKKGIVEAEGTSAYIREALQEGIEEDVNLWAEGEGKIRGGLEKEEGTAFDRFIKSSATQEGILNFALGSIGGIGQKLALGKIPYREYTDPATGKTKRVNNDFLNEIQTNQAFKSQVLNVRDDFNNFFQAQKNLSTAIASGNPEMIKQSRELLFDVSAYKSIRDDNSDLLVNELQEIAATDNTEIEEDGKTQAQRKGYTESLNDNTYKETAVKKIGEVQQLQKEYNNISAKFETKRGKDKAFEQYLQMYRKNDQANNLQSDINQKIASYSQLATDPNLVTAIDYEAALTGLDQAIESTTNPKIKKSLEDTKAIKQAEYNNLRKEGGIQTKGLKDNQGLITDLSKSYASYFNTNEEARLAKIDYNKILNSSEEFDAKVKKQDEELRKILEKANKEANKKADKQEQADNITKAAEEKKKQKRESLLRQVALANTEKDLDAYLKEADDNQLTDPDLLDAIAKRRNIIKTQSKPAPPAPPTPPAPTPAPTQKKTSYVSGDVVELDPFITPQPPQPTNTKSTKTDNKSKIVATLKEINTNKQLELTPEQETTLASDEEFATKVHNIMERLNNGEMLFDFSIEEQEIINEYGLLEKRDNGVNQLEGINGEEALEYHGGADSKDTKTSQDKENGPKEKKAKGNEIIYNSRETKKTTDEKGNTTYEKEPASTPIIDSSKIVHSPSFGVDSEIEIRIEAEQETTSSNNVDTKEQSFKDAKTKEELIKAAEDWIGINPYDSNSVSMDTRSLLLTPGFFEKGKEKFINEFKGVIDQRNKTEDKTDIESLLNDDYPYSGMNKVEMVIAMIAAGEFDVHGTDVSSLRLDLEMSTAELTKAVNDIKKRNFGTKPAIKLLAKLQEMINNKHLIYIEGAGGLSNRISKPINRPPRENKPQKTKQLDIETFRTEILYNGVKIGYLPQPAFVRPEDQALNRLIRQHLLDNGGSIKTKINNKKIGNINNNTEEKSNVVDAFPILDGVDFVIGKDNAFWIGKTSQYEGEVIDTTIKDGYVYAIVTTPNGKRFAIPIDINKASEAVADAIIEATRIFVNRKNLTDDQIKQLANFPFNITDPIGFQQYIESLLPTTDLRDPIVNATRTKGNFIYTTASGISFMKGKGASSTVFNVALNSPESLYRALRTHITDMYIKIDLNSVKENRAVNIPSVKIENGKVVISDLIKHNSYKDYIANNTNTNVLGIKLNDTEMTTFIHPFVTFDTSFLDNIDKKVTEIEIKPEQKAILASAKKIVPSRSLAAGLPIGTTNPDRVTDEQAKEAEKICPF